MASQYKKDSLPTERDDLIHSSVNVNYGLLQFNELQVIHHRGWGTATAATVTADDCLKPLDN